MCNLVFNFQAFLQIENFLSIFIDKKIKENQKY